MECPNCKTEMEYICRVVEFYGEYQKWYCPQCDEFMEMEYQAYDIPNEYENVL